MAKILVVYYSSYGHIEQMAQAVAEGARSVAGTDVLIKRVAELVPEDIARKSGIKLDHHHQCDRGDCADRQPQRARRLRCSHLRHANPIRRHGSSNA